MKRLITFLLIFSMLGSVFAYAEDGVKVTERKSKKDEAWLWEELSKYSPNDYITAGILSYFWRESQYKSDSVSGWASLKVYNNFDLCRCIREKTDKGLSDGSSRDFFIKTIRSRGGFGLGQWYSMGYLESLYDYAKEYGTSIVDARMQCAFIFESLKDNKELWKRLIACSDPEKAGRLIAIYYDGTENGAEYIGQKAEKLYEKYYEEAVDQHEHSSSTFGDRSFDICRRNRIWTRLA